MNPRAGVLVLGHSHISFFCFVWGFNFVHYKIFHSYGDVTISGERLQILTYVKHSKGSKDIEQPIQWAEKSGLILTFEHDLKINRDHLLIEGNPCTNFGIDQVKGSKDIERTKFGLQTDRQLQNNMPPF